MKKKLTLVISVYCAIFFLFSLVYLSLFHTFLFKSQTILFYRGIILLAITLSIFLILAIGLNFKLKKLYLESILAAILVSTSFHLSLFVVFPVTFERSVTMYLLNTLAINHNDQSCQGLAKSQLQDKLIKEYVLKNKALDKRLSEQKVINIINGNQECVQLTQQGLDFLKLSELIKKIYGF